MKPRNKNPFGRIELKKGEARLSIANFIINYKESYKRVKQCQSIKGFDRFDTLDICLTTLNELCYEFNELSNVDEVLYKIIKDHLDINNGGKANEHIKNKNEFLVNYKRLYDKIVDSYQPIIDACTNKLCDDCIEKQKKLELYYKVINDYISSIIVDDGTVPSINNH
ncbi:MAG: hypothetical protein WC307_00595 [Candidatus Nanoarchaeia archaeon]|jgi:hypothetical protein